ncbi:MAG: hypothetical protein MK082_11140 [Phycisphaerales bacterium]|nr:hypothetical protein [Phycisphaerales bacterium]
MIDQLSSIAMPPALDVPKSGLPLPGTASFEEVLAEKQGHDQRATIREESRKLVAEAFIAPLLAKIREQNQAAAPFGTTDGEKRLGPIFDRAVADSMTDPERFPMVKAVERSMLDRLDALGQGAA